MIGKQILSVCAAVFCFYVYEVVAQSNGAGSSPPRTRFTCTGRPSGYYADMDTGCQVYHMCDGLGRQFSYSCPNTTLFQQRMLICDHWYMVNCSMSERDYDANLLIGQRDKPFVSDEEMRQRTPRPDILSVPPNSNYYDGLREAETKFPIHPDNSIVGVADSISKDNNGLDSGKQHNYRPPTGWSTKRRESSTSFVPTFSTNVDNLAVAASQRPTPTVQPLKTRPTEANTATAANVTPPSRELVPPVAPPTTESDSEEVQIDARMKPTEDPIVTFIKRFDPNSPDTPKTRDTAMTRTEIIDLNKLLPEGQISSEDDRTPKKNKNFTNKNQVQEITGKSNAGKSNNNSVKTTTPANAVSVPDSVLVPPKSEFSDAVSTTVGPPIYYEWKWAVPAFDLEAPKLGNETNSTTPRPQRTNGRSPFRDVTRRPTPAADDEPTPAPKNVEYNISSYFVPDYVFPLDKPHPGYEGDDAQTSFQVKVAREGRSYGENPACPQCHPAYVQPGSCEPCILLKR